MKPLTLSGRMTVDGITETQVVRLRRPDGRPAEPREAALVRSVEDLDRAARAGFEVAVGPGLPEMSSATIPITIGLDPSFDYLDDGDVIALRAGSVRTLYRKSAKHNGFLVTERCNHYCLMCSQPPRKVEDGWILDEIASALPLIPKDAPSLGFTGGEPLTEWRRFIDLLGQTKSELPHTAIQVLTNGRAFADAEIVNAWAAVGHPNLSAGIPLYSAVDHIHDHVVQAKGAFNETVLGILRMKDRGQRVQIRVVLHALTAPRLAETCRWIARNLPFVDHVALMGLENTGFAIANDAMLWIDPVDYQEALTESIESLDAARVRVSIFNLPLCVLDPSIRPYAVQSISDWKNAYLPECDACQAKAQCAGFFSSGRPKFSRGIAPIQALA
jgi:His-Xaa-Ser system radical SAM maturase HxsC